MVVMMVMMMMMMMVMKKIGIIFRTAPSAWRGW